MEIKLGWLLVLLLAAVSGCGEKPTMIDPDSGYVYIGVDPNSAQVYVMTLMPGISSMYEQENELAAQNRWLRRSLDKCLEKLETEMGLEPIPRKYQQVLRGDPKLADEYPQPSESWFVPYESPDTKPLSEPRDILMLKAMMSLRSASMRMYVSYTEDWIENFEQRLKRLESHLEE